MDVTTFILVSFGLLVIPGPTVIALTSTSMVHGRVRGLQALAGSSTAMILQLFIAGVSTSWFISSIATGFFWLKWFGVLYLVYLGIKQIYMVYKPVKVTITSAGSFGRGFFVTLTNPKTILFFSAFLPQFVHGSSAYLPQIALLSLIFWCLAFVLDCTFVLLASKASPFLKSDRSAKYQNGITGTLYLGAGALLANTKTG